MTYLFMMVFLASLAFEILSQASGRKIGPTMNKEESSSLCFILLGDDRSIYDYFNNNIHPCNK
jgi:hypothetical protein